MASILCRNVDGARKLTAWLLTGATCLLLSGCGDSSLGPARVSDAPTTVQNLPLMMIDNEVLVRVHSGVLTNQLLDDYNLMPGGALPDGSTYRALLTSGTTQAMIDALQSDTRVQEAEINLVVASPVVRQTSIAFNEGFLSPGQFFATNLVERLHLLNAHAGSKGLGVTVAVIDNGVDLHHPVLEGRIAPDSYDFIENDAQPDDSPDGIDNDGDGQIDEETGHGTAVAGLVALVAPSARILCLRALNSDGQGTAFNVANAIEYAVDHGAKVINLSIALTATSYALDAAVQYATDHGCIMVTGAGNNGSVQFPATDPRVWAVAALAATTNYPASFTSAFIGVELSAPGENILSTAWNDGYQAWSGTSMSSPLVAGAAALVLAIHPSWTNAQVLQLLSNTASMIPGHPDTMGAGALDPGAAIGPAPDVNIRLFESNRK